MKIAYLVPGSGGTFYCENCLRDIPLIQALKRQGLEVTLVPLYLPLFTEEESQEGKNPVFFGALSLYLDNKYPWFQRMPGFIRNLLDRRFLLKIIAHFSGSTEARGLETMTLDMISGDHLLGNREYLKLLHYLKDQIGPNILHLSNALLLGLGRQLKTDLGIPLVCSLQDEDVWLDAMAQPFRTKAYELLTLGAQDVDHFFPVSRYFALLLGEKLNLLPHNWTVVSPGVDRVRYLSLPEKKHGLGIGYLYRLAEPYGLEDLARIYLSLLDIPELSALQFHISGGFTGHDLPFVNRVKKILQVPVRSGLVHFHAHFGFGHRRNFFSQVNVLCVPLRKPEAFGTYVLEALAYGIPVVEPSHGAFPEIIQQTEGGLLYTPQPPLEEPLKEALKTILLNPTLRQTLGSRGKAAVNAQWTTDQSAATFKEIYSKISTEIYNNNILKEVP